MELTITIRRKNMNRKHTDEEREQSTLYYLKSGKGMLQFSK